MHHRRGRGDRARVGRPRNTAVDQPTHPALHSSSPLPRRSTAWRRRPCPRCPLACRELTCAIRLPPRESEQHLILRPRPSFLQLHPSTTGREQRKLLCRLLHRSRGRASVLHAPMPMDGGRGTTGGASCCRYRISRGSQRHSQAATEEKKREKRDRTRQMGLPKLAERREARFRFIDFRPRATTDRDRTTGSSMRASICLVTLTYHFDRRQD